MTDTTKCPDCGGPAQVRERFVLESTDGPVEHARTSCARGHHFVLGLEALTRPPMRPARGDGLLRIMLLCSAFNGLTQRAWIELRAAGHEVTVQHAGDGEALRAAVAAIRPDVLICPFLRERVPEDVWRSYLTIVIHPGPQGDRGPSSLDWAIMSAEPVWGVTALQAIDEMDAGPIWASRTFAVDTEPPRKSALYNGSVTDIAAALIHEVVAKVADPGFAPEPLDYTRAGVRGRLRPAARQSDRSFSWSDPTERVLRRIRAADGAPGVHTQLCGMPVTVFDAHPARIHPRERAGPGTVVGRRHGAVLVRTGDGGIWVGQLRSRGPGRVSGTWVERPSPDGPCRHQGAPAVRRHHARRGPGHLNGDRAAAAGHRPYAKRPAAADVATKRLPPRLCSAPAPPLPGERHDDRASKRTDDSTRPEGHTISGYQAHDESTDEGAHEACRECESPVNTLCRPAHDELRGGPDEHAEQDDAEDEHVESVFGAGAVESSETGCATSG
jgi:methionyl-tRNA formyltransferase